MSNYAGVIAIVVGLIYFAVASTYADLVWLGNDMTQLPPRDANSMYGTEYPGTHYSKEP